MERAVNVRIHRGWFGTSLEKDVGARIQHGAQVISVTPNYKGPFFTVCYACVGVLTLGFYIPTPGVTAVLEIPEESDYKQAGE